MSINRLLQDSAFEPEQIDRIAEAYKRVLHALRLINRIDPLTEIVAENIFEVAQTGEFDISRITELTLKDFQNTPVTAAEPEHGLNQRAEELRRIATANLSDGEALAALGTALGEEVATMIVRHPPLRWTRFWMWFFIASGRTPVRASGPASALNPKPIAKLSRRRCANTKPPLDAARCRTKHAFTARVRTAHNRSWHKRRKW